MDPDEHKMMERLLKISEENNRILRIMHRHIIFKRLTHFIYWVVILGVSIASYYLIKPYLTNLQGAFDVIDQYTQTENM